MAPVSNAIRAARRADAAKGRRCLFTHPKGFTEIEEQARRLRKTLGIDGFDYPNLADVLHELPDVYPGFKLTSVADRELPHCEAEADCYEKKITVRESVYDAALRDDARARFTLAHEIGHIALGHAGTRLRSTSNNSASFTRNRKREESEASMFAEAFLAPTFLARTCKSAKEICARFGLSKTAAKIRFDRLAQLIQQGPAPSERWKSGPRTLVEPSNDHLPKKERTTAGTPRLPNSVADFLSEARRRGHPVTSLRDSDEEQK
jgi:hypothetical protein